MKSILLSIFLLTLITTSYAQEGSVWSTLSNLTVERQFDELTGMTAYKPNFFPNVLELDGSEIVIEGYIIPLSGKKAQSHFMFSKFPVNMCFFCGKAGPESAIQVFMLDSKKVQYTDQRITLKGTFRINRDLNQQMFYNLENAEKL